MDTLLTEIELEIADGRGGACMALHLHGDTTEAKIDKFCMRVFAKSGGLLNIYVDRDTMDGEAVTASLMLNDHAVLGVVEIIRKTLPTRLLVDAYIGVFSDDKFLFLVAVSDAPLKGVTA
ncbi:hypothetical protein [Shimia thalassica]|uniref:hypothetical protein n=1 Tax=Shimia thalassica TaxID=1715693 RepID=UPI0026E130AE|nr:hypothetical protein [Shimia thalassica]MDO6480962.1 hypothetical protein [Shimia thalassica]